MSAALEISLRIGQRVRHHDFHGKRVTGVVRGLSVEGETDALHADIVLDEPLVIPPLHDGDHEIRIHRQHVPAHELSAFDDRDELIAEMLAVLQQVQDGVFDADPIAHSNWLARVDAVAAKATGAAA